MNSDLKHTVRDLDMPYEDVRVGRLLRRVRQLAQDKYNARLRDFDVTVRQAAALQSIARFESLSQAEIGAAIGMEPANVHGLVSRLKSKGLLAVSRDPLKPKRMSVRLTDAGQQLIPSLKHAGDLAEADTLANLDADERSRFWMLLNKILYGPPPEGMPAR